MKISFLTRRDLFDVFHLEKISWSGRLDEPDFLARLYDLQAMPSTDSRFPNAGGDIWQHRINNNDWSDDWVFTDDRFDLTDGDDEVLLRFLCETVHPVVRSDPTEAVRLVQLYNSVLRNDGFELVEMTRLSGKPVFAGRPLLLGLVPAIATAKEALAHVDAAYISAQITRMEAAVSPDPALAIGTAKELVETVCKTILADESVEDLTVPQLVKATVKKLGLAPDDIPAEAKAAETIKRLLSNLASVAGGLAELRNEYGTGHGKRAGTHGLQARHAKLAVGAASTLAVFLFETHKERGAK